MEVYFFLSSTLFEYVSFVVILKTTEASPVSFLHLLHAHIEFGTPDRLFVSLIRLTLERACELCARAVACVGVRARGTITAEPPPMLNPNHDK